MNTILLQYAVEVEKTGSITQAAANLFMDQPNLSKAIKSLEETMGAPIFKRTPKGMVPTARGRVFLSHARKVLAQIEEMENLYRRNQKNKVEFSLSMPRNSYISLAFSNFIRNIGKQDSMRVWIKETDNAETLKNVESGEYRLGILHYQPASEKYYEKRTRAAGLFTEKIFTSPMKLLVSRQNPLASLKKITPESLLEYTKITFGGDSYEPGSEDGKKEEAMSPAKIIYTFERASQLELLCENPEAYMWTTPVPEEIRNRYGLVERKPEWLKGRLSDSLIYQKGYSLTPWDRKFLDELNAVKSLFFDQEC